MNDTDRIRDALSYLDPAMSRDDWVKVGMAIKSELGEEGFGLWDDWSRGADCYDARCARDTWRSCKPNGGVTGGSLFYMARSCGWRNNGQKPTPEEIEARRREAAERAAKEKARKAREHAQAARRAGEIWEAATPAQADHPYLVRKRISPTVGLREMEAQTVAEILGYAPKQGDEPLVGRLLVVPVKVAGDLSTLEHIDETGRKSTLSGGKKSGGYWDAQELPEGDGTGITILVGEGVATTLSAREATGHLAVAALTSGNLLAVAREMRQRYPKAVLVVLADLVKTTGEPDPHAIEAARAVGGKQVVPKFPEPRDPEHTDMNDLAAACGMEAVRALIDKAEPPGQEADQSSENPIPPLSERPCFRVFHRHRDASAGGWCGSIPSTPTSWRPVMGLESLLARLEGRPVTPVTAGYVVYVTENPLQNEHVTPVTLVSQNGNLDSASEPGDGGFRFGQSRGHIQIHVTDVTDVQTRRNAGSGCYVTKKPDVTAVTEPAVVGGVALPGVSHEFAARLSAEDLDEVGGALGAPHSVFESSPPSLGP